MTRNSSNVHEKGDRHGKDGKTGKYLTFFLDQETYGLEVLKVKEIVGIVDITPVPNAPPYVKGVMNLRGKIIPVIDLRLKFGFPEREYTERTCIIVVESEQARGKTLTGIVVDSVSEVANISETDVEAAPDFGAEFTTDFVMGLAKAKGTVIIMLDIGRVLETSGLVQLATPA